MVYLTGFWGEEPTVVGGEVGGCTSWFSGRSVGLQVDDGGVCLVGVLCEGAGDVCGGGAFMVRDGLWVVAEPCEGVDSGRVSGEPGCEWVPGLS